LVLASNSPRRRLLLELLGVPFCVVASTVDESQIETSAPDDFARQAARLKCIDVAGRVAENSIVLGADTVVHFPGPNGDPVMLGKPSGPTEAKEMLQRLSGRTHQVTTAVAVSRPGGSVRLGSETSDVRFRPLSRDEIDSYVATGESLGKAGAYAVQGRGGQFIESVEGDLQNVIGLPLRLLVDMLVEDLPDLEMPDEEALKRLCRQPPS